MATYILARKNQLAGDLADEVAAMDLSEAAWNLAPDPRMQALARTYAAHGLALAGQRLDCLRALDDARTVAANAEGDASTGWARWLDAAYIEVQRARCLTILGEAGRAVGLFQAAIDDLPASYRRDRGV